MTRPDRILLLNIAGIGDFIDSTPALREARALCPQAYIALAVSEKAFPLARSCPYVNEVIPIPTSSGSAIPKKADLMRWLSGLWHIRARFDTVLNLYVVASRQGMWWMRFLSRWCGGRASQQISASPDVTDASERAMNVVSVLGKSAIAAARPDRFELWLSEESQSNARRMLSGVNDLVVFLGGERRTRHESSERAELWLSQIQERWKIHTVIVGTLNDPGLPPSTSIRHTDLRGKCTLEETAAVISKAAALITTHSAPQHFASVWQIPTIVLVGPGDAARYHPNVAEDRVRLLRNAVSCSPCYHAVCPRTGPEYQHCLTGITPESVVEAFEDIASMLHLV